MKDGASADVHFGGLAPQTPKSTKLRRKGENPRIKCTGTDCWNRIHLSRGPRKRIGRTQAKVCGGIRSGPANHNQDLSGCRSPEALQIPDLAMKAHGSGTRLNARERTFAGNDPSYQGKTPAFDFMEPCRPGHVRKAVVDTAMQSQSKMDGSGTLPADSRDVGIREPVCNGARNGDFPMFG